ALPDEMELIAGPPDVGPAPLNGPSTATQRLAAGRGRVSRVCAGPATRTGSGCRRGHVRWSRVPGCIAGQDLVIVGGHGVASGVAVASGGGSGVLGRSGAVGGAV